LSLEKRFSKEHKTEYGGMGSDTLFFLSVYALEKGQGIFLKTR
jgi:hypothetical protein